MTTPHTFLSELVGCMSQGAAGNPTVAMIESAFAQLGLQWRYINLEVAPADLADAVRGVRAMRFRGFNCSLPHKVAVIQHLDGLGESAGLMGAVNCVVRRGDKLIGENTDGKGFLKSLAAIIDPKGKNVVMFGAGGAARAIAVELGLAGVSKFTVVNRSEGRGRDLADLLRSKLKVDTELVLLSDEYAIPGDTDVVINATSIGLYAPEVRVPVDIRSFHPGMIVADVVFSPPRTAFLREAEACGCTTLDGLGMLVNQGVIGVQFWTGIEPDAEGMRRALEEAMGLC